MRINFEDFKDILQISEIANLQSSLDAIQTDLDSKLESADLTGLQTQIDGKAPASHSHSEAEITGLTADLAGKAAASHTHTESQITGLTADLAGKAPLSHSHAIADVTGLQSAIDSPRLPYLYKAGFNVSNAADANNDITISAGECRDFLDTENIRNSTLLTKQSDAAWTVGTNAGGLTRLSAKTFVVAKRTRASNVAKLKIGTGHGFKVGDHVIISNVSGTGYNSDSATPNRVIITDVTTGTDFAGDSVSYSNTGSNESVTADGGGRVSIHTLHLEIIKRPDTGIVDARWTPDLSAGLNLPANYTVYRRIASIPLDKNGNLPGIIQKGKKFMYIALPALDIDTSSLGTTPTTFGLSHVPIGLKIFALLNTNIYNASGASVVRIYDPDISDQGANNAATPLAENGNSGSGLQTYNQVSTFTSVLAQIRAVAAIASSVFRVAIRGWEDDFDA